MVTAPPLSIDYAKFNDIKSGLSLHISEVMEQSARAGARAVLEMALGHFSLDADSRLLYMGQAAPEGLLLDSWV